MPKYKIKDPKSGKTLTVTSNRQPTQEEAQQIFAEQETTQLTEGKTQELSFEEEPIKLTEETIKKDPQWISAAKQVYQLNEGADAPELDSDEQYANYGLRYMGWFNYNLPKMGLEATQLKQGTDEQKQAFVTLMDMYDEKAASWAGAGRAALGILSDPSTYVGVGTFGTATAGAQALKQAIKEGVKQGTKTGLKEGAKIGALEGAAYATADNALRQTARINAGAQDAFDFGQSAKAAALGGSAGTVLGGTVGGIGGRSSAKKYQEKIQEIETKDLASQKQIETDPKLAAQKATEELKPDLQKFNREVAEDVRAEQNQVREDFQADLNLEINQKGIDVGIEILDELKIPRNPNVQISDQLFDALQLVNTQPIYKDSFLKILKKNNINEIEFAQLFKLGASDAGRRLAQLSVANRAMKDIGNELSGLAPKDGMATGLLRKFGDTAYKLDNIRRGLLVSQIATSMRNFTAQIGRVGVHTLTGAMDNALNATFNPLRRLFGNEAVDHTNSFGLLLNLTTDKKFAKDATEFATKYFVNEKDRLFNRYASDVADASQTQTMKGAQKVVDGLNFLNRMQEFYYRRGMFASSLEETLRKKGISLKEAVESNDISRITKADVEKAVDDALEFTYAKTPDNKLGKAFVDLSNSIPFITTGVVPFARFMTNAMKFQFQHSPLGPLALLSGKERAAVAKGDMSVFSKAMVGSALLMAAVEAKRRGFGGEKWYELKGTDGTTIDARPYFPMTPYLLVADLIVRTEDGRIPPDAKDILQGLTGAQFRTGTGLALIDSIINDVAGVDSEEKISKTITRFISDVLGSYLTPFRMFGDFTNQQQTFRTALPETQKFEDIPANVLEQFKRSIPGVRETLPELESPTRAAAPGRPEKVRIPFTDIQVPGPLARQLTGITVSEEKNPAEKELDRLGFKRRDILPYTGDQIADQLNAKYLGPVLEKVVSAVVQKDGYKKLSNPEKEIVMRGILKELRSTTKDYAVAENPQRFVKIYLDRLPRATRKLLKDEIQNIKQQLEK